MRNWSLRDFSLLLLVASGGAAIFAHSMSWAIFDATWTHRIVLAVLLGTTAILAAFPSRIPGTKMFASTGDSFAYCAVLFSGPFGGALVTVLDHFISSRRLRQGFRQSLFSCSVSAVSVFLGAMTFSWLLPVLKPQGREISLESLIAPVAAMSLVHFVSHSSLVALMVSLKGEGRPLRTWRHQLSWTSITYFSAASVGLLLYTVGTGVGWIAGLVLIPIVMIVYYTFKTYEEKVEQKQRHSLEMDRAYLNTIEPLAMAIEAKIHSTHNHVVRVQTYAVELGKLAGMNRDELEGLKAAALLHDIGKLAIPEHILRKPDRLDDEEYERMKLHPQIGADILKHGNFPYPVVEYVQSHHEKWNGKGYPEGIKGEAIPIGARVLTIADCYDAMRMSRPYRAAMTRKDVLSYIDGEAGNSYDPRLCELFIENIDALEASAQWLEDTANQMETDEMESDVAPEVECHDSPHVIYEKAEDLRKLWMARKPSFYGDIASANEEVIAMYEIAHSFGGALSLEDAMNTTLKRIERILKYRTCVVFLYEPGKQTATAEYVGGKNPEVFRGRTVKMGQGAVGWVLKNRRHLVHLTPKLELLGVKENVRAQYTGAAVFPLLADNELIGAITLYTEGELTYTDDQVRIMERLSRHAARALQNSMVYENTRKTAYTDVLTGLPNARYLQTKFMQDVARANRDESAVSLLLMDLDHFKEVNDRYGHQAGDKFLRDVVKVMKKALRGEDTLIRYAGDEFVAILPNSGPDDWPRVATRLRDAVTNFRVEVLPDQFAEAGLSVGASIYPEDGTSLEKLLAKADQRMYEDKRARKEAAGQSFSRPVSAPTAAAPQ